MIELRDVSVSAGTFRLERVSFRVDEGQYAILMGRTGFGKTTILEAICGLRKIRSGKILIDGVDVTNLSPADRNIGYVPQDLALFPTMTVRQHLEFGLRLKRIGKVARAARVNELAEVLGLGKLLSRGIRGLSGGESQRVALGRALAHHPPVLLLDEPLSALDEETRMEMHQLLRDVRQTNRVTTLHVTHHREDSRALADCRLKMEEDGSINMLAQES